MQHKLTLLPHLIKHTPKTIVHDSKQASGSITVYAFDLDHTIVRPRTPGLRFSRSADDWEFMSFSAGRTAFEKLLSLVMEDPSAHVVIFSNQGGVITVPPTSKSCLKYTQKIELILEEISRNVNGTMLTERLWIYASTKRSGSLVDSKRNTKKSGLMKIAKLSNGTQDKKSVSKSLPSLLFIPGMRKPEIGMAHEFRKDMESVYPGFDIEYRYFCGDAAGRPKDFSDSDKIFAQNLDVPFKVPEDVF